MVRRLYLLLACVASLSGWAAAAQLSVHTGAQQVEMGKYLSARILYLGKQAVGPADLRQWQDDFHIDRRGIDSERLADGQVRTTQQLRLYPKRSGELLLEAIALGGAIARPQRIHSLPSVRDGIDGTPRWQALPAQVWQGQAFEIGIQVALLHPSNHIAAEELLAPGLTVLELPRIEDRGKGSVTLRWRLIARDSGHLSIHAPIIEQRGRGRWRYYLPQQTLHVLPLPSYLPPNVPVGRLRLQSKLIDSEDSPVWEVSVLNHGELPDEVHGLRRQLAAIAGRDIASVTLTPVGSDGDVSKQRYRVRVPEWSWGFGTGPQISIPYFDVHDGRLLSAEVQLPAVWGIPAGGQIVLALIVFGLALMFMRSSIKLAQRRVQRQRFRQRLAQATNVQELRALLLDWSSASTLSQWQAQAATGEAQAIASALNRLCYAKCRDEQALANIKQAIRNMT